jgi:hypothetical protein
MENKITFDALKELITDEWTDQTENPNAEDFAPDYDYCTTNYDIMEEEHKWLLKAAFKKAVKMLKDSNQLKTTLTAAGVPSLTIKYDDVHHFLSEGITHSNGYKGNLHELSEEDVELHEHQFQGFTFFFIPDENEGGIILAPTEFFNLFK